MAHYFQCIQLENTLESFMISVAVADLLPDSDTWKELYIAETFHWEKAKNHIIHFIGKRLPFCKTDIQCIEGYNKIWPLLSRATIENIYNVYIEHLEKRNAS